MTQKLEVWLPVPGYEGRYSVSDFGNVMSMNWNNTDLLKILKPARGSHGYLQVNLWKNDKPKSNLVHSLVASAFIGERRKGLHINHKSGIKTDNRASNLEYVTRSQNSQHALSMGLLERGETHYRSILTEAQVIDIKRKIAYGIKPSEIAKEYNVSYGAIRNIATGKNWKHLNETMQ